MKTTATIIAIAGLILATICPVHAQGTEWERFTKEVMELYRTGEYERAVVAAKKALEVAERNAGPDHPAVATSLGNLAGLYKTQGQYAQAEPLFKRALAIMEKALGPEHPAVATSLENIAELYRKVGRAKEAESLASRAARIRAIKR